MASKGLRRIGFCPHCCNTAPQRLVHEHGFFGRSFKVDGSLSGYDLPSRYFVAVCETCAEVLVYLEEGTMIQDDNFTDAMLMWPMHRLVDGSVPTSVRSSYEEALRIKWVSPNGFAVLIRRAIEAICEDRGAKKSSLAKSLLELADRGEIPPTLAETTDVLRLLGNIGAHATKGEVKAGQVRAIDEFFQAVVEYVYIGPQRVREFKKHLAPPST